MWAWVTPSSRAGRMMVKRLCACARCSSERAVNGGTAGFVIPNHLPEAENQSHALPPSISDHPPNCQNFAHGIPKFTITARFNLREGPVTIEAPDAESAIKLLENLQKMPNLEAEMQQLEAEIQHLRARPPRVSDVPETQENEEQGKTI